MLGTNNTSVLPANMQPMRLTVKFRLFQDFDFPDEHVVERVNRLAAFLYVLADAVRDTAVHQKERVEEFMSENV